MRRNKNKNDFIELFLNVRLVETLFDFCLFRNFNEETNEISPQVSFIILLEIKRKATKRGEETH